MMLSAQAARMGTVYTTLRSIGKVGTSRFKGSFSSCRVDSMQSTTFRNEKNKQLLDTFQKHQLQRKHVRSSTNVAAFESESDDDDEPQTLAYTHLGHAAAAQIRAKNVPQEEPWMINLGRGNDNAWLMGPRNEQEWFTGLAPADDCPGKLEV